MTDDSKVQLTSPDVRFDFKDSPFERSPDPFWPELGFTFPASPKELQDWATLIWEASDFLQLLDEDN